MTGRRTLPPTPAATATAFEKFARAGYPFAKFTEALYHDLRHCFGFLAHTDRSGFYGARFATPALRAATLDVMERYVSPGGARPTEAAVRAVVARLNLVGAADREHSTELLRTEQREFERLRNKFEDPVGYRADLNHPTTVTTVRACAAVDRVAGTKPTVTAGETASDFWTAHIGKFVIDVTRASCFFVEFDAGGATAVITPPLRYPIAGSPRAETVAVGDVLHVFDLPAIHTTREASR
jgi:hypothetical protein